jgi:hypothetical protein
LCLVSALFMGEYCEQKRLLDKAYLKVETKRLGKVAEFDFPGRRNAQPSNGHEHLYPLRSGL